MRVGSFEMSRPDTPDDLKSLGERLDKARRDRTGPAADDGKGDGAFQRAVGLGFRIGLELVVAVVVGLGIGWAIDRALGTKPWVMILFLFLGFAAGLVNVFRAVRGMGMEFGYRTPQQGAQPPEDEEE
jgi:ATP synthase protein I